MTRQELLTLERGDIVKHKSENSKTFVVTGNYGGRITAAATVDITNPDEWLLMFKANYKNENTKTKT